MTREEAIRCLSVHSSTNGSGLCTDEQHYKAKQMAIQALENHETFMKYAYSQGKHDALSQEPTTTTNNNEPITIIYPTIVCDDAISREAVIEWLENATYEDISDAVGTELSFLPSVTQKSGKWNEYYTSQKGNDVFNCKECGHTFVVTQGKDNMNFCPNCGADMRDKVVEE